MLHPDLSGVVAASVTPVDAQFQIDTDRLAQHCEALISNGCAFVSTFGTTGEGASLSTAQKIVAMQRMKADGVPTDRHIPAIMTPTTDEAGRMVAAASELGCRAVLVLPPFYYADPSQEGLVAFFETLLRIAGNPDIDILLYNIPRFSRITYDQTLIEKLIDRFGNRIVGIKDSTGDLDNALMLTRTFPQLSVFTGDDRVLPHLIAAGGAGIIGGMPNLFAADARRVIMNPLGAETLEIRDLLAKRIVAVDQSGSLVAIKAALAALYQDIEWTRAVPPLTALMPAQISTLLEKLAEAGYQPGKAA